MSEIVYGEPGAGMSCRSVDQLLINQNKEPIKTALRNKMCSIEEAQDCCSELDHDELELKLCDVETAYVHLDRDLGLTDKDLQVIKHVMN